MYYFTFTVPDLSPNVGLCVGLLVVSRGSRGLQVLVLLHRDLRLVSKLFPLPVSISHTCMADMLVFTTVTVREGLPHPLGYAGVSSPALSLCILTRYDSFGRGVAF